MLVGSVLVLALLPGGLPSLELPDLDEPGVSAVVGTDAPPPSSAPTLGATPSACPSQAPEDLPLPC